MSIEVRQISIHSRVGVPANGGPASLPDRERDRLKEEILSECKQMILDLLRVEKER